MKVLLVHNDYAKYSGEEAVVDKMAAMLRSNGHEVCFYRSTTVERRETSFGKIEGFFAGIYSYSGVKGMRNILKCEKPDVVNVHNLYPFISPAALFECKKAGVPVVMTVHNYRLVCPTGLFMRDGNPCETCLHRKTEWNCIWHNCEHSLLKSVGYTLRNVYARWTGAYKKNVDAFACLTAFQREKLVVAGYDKEKIIVIPNSINAPEKFQRQQGEYVTYIGRLSYEKGYDLLVEVARRNPDIRFRFAGAKRNDVKDFPENVRLMGYLKDDELTDFIRKARFVVIPSRCYEGFPMAILEAAHYGKPCVAPDHGGFTDIIGKGEEAIGCLFAPNNIDELENQIVNLWNNPDIVEKLGKKSFEKLRREYCSEVIYEKWMNLFNKIINEK